MQEKNENNLGDRKLLMKVNLAIIPPEILLHFLRH